MRHVRCKSGLMGSRDHLRKNYENYEEFVEWDQTYGISRRLGFQSSLQAWEANPLIEWSVEPSDLRVA